jgi:hypothetical protein
MAPFIARQDLNCCQNAVPLAVADLAKRKRRVAIVCLLDL